MSYPFGTVQNSSNRKDQLTVWFQSLQNLFWHSLPSVHWMLDSLSRDTGWSYDFLLQCPDINVRRPFAGVVCHVLGIAVNNELKQWQESSRASDEKATAAKVTAASANATAVVPAKAGESKLGPDPTYVSPENHTSRLGDTLVRFLPLAPAHWKRFDQYLRVISYFASLSVFHGKPSS
jgi:hypothetical protein